VDEPAPRFNLAIVLRELGRKNEALATLKDLVSSDPIGPFAERSRELDREIRGELAREVRESLTAQGVAPEAFGEPLPVGGEVTAPVKIYAPPPRYPMAARKKGVQGVVIVMVIIDEEGRVAYVAILRGLSEGLNEAAVAAVKHWRFKPATLNGKPVTVRYNLTISFRLEARDR